MGIAVQESGIKTFGGNDEAVRERVKSSVMDAIEIVTGCSRSVLTENSELGIHDWTRVRNYLITSCLFCVTDITFKETFKRISIREILAKIQVQMKM